MWHGNDLVPDVPAAIPWVLAWQHPGELKRFGRAALPVSNIADHLMPGILRDAAQLAG